MKKIFLFLSAVLIVTFAAGSNAQIGEQNDKIQTFQSSPAWKKLDGTLQNAWLNAIKSGDMERRLDCFVRGKEFLDQGDQSFLISRGFNLRASTGYIARGYLAADDLPDVAALPFVASVKLSDKSE